MSVFNVRVFNYVDGQQIRIYSDLQNAEEYKKMYDLKERKEKVMPLEGVDDQEIWDNIGYYEPFLDVMYEDYEIKANKERSLKNSKSRTIQKIYEITRSNKWEYFITLTFNPEKVDSFNYDEVVKKLSKWLNNIKSVYAPDLKYIIVPELHKSGRFHFHGLFADIGSMQLVDSRKKLSDGTVIYNIGNYKLGFTTATKIKDNARVSSYITKYISKDLCVVTANKKRYWCSRNLDTVQITDYVLEPHEIKQLLEDLSENITYMKTTNSVMTGNRTRYIEVK